MQTHLVNGRKVNLDSKRGDHANVIYSVWEPQAFDPATDHPSATMNARGRLLGRIVSHWGPARGKDDGCQRWFDWYGPDQSLNSEPENFNERLIDALWENIR